MLIGKKTKPVGEYSSLTIMKKSHSVTKCSAHFKFHWFHLQPGLIWSSWVAFLQPSLTQYHIHHFHAWSWRNLKWEHRRMWFERNSSSPYYHFWSRNLTLSASSICVCGTFVSPVTVPGVCSQPVRCPILLPPAQDLDGMTTQHFPSYMLVHTCSKSL